MPTGQDRVHKGFRRLAIIVGVSKPGQIEDLVGTLGVELSAEEMTALEAPYRPRPTSGQD